MSINFKMTDTEETEILKLLYNYKNEHNKINNIPDYPLTDSNFIKIISKSVTDIIYNSYKNKSLNGKKTRETVIDLLKKWIEPNSHLPIDESNYDIFIKCLNKPPSISETFYQKFGQKFLQEASETSKIKKKDDWENICETVNKKYVSSLENKIKSGLIQTWNKNNFEKTDFDYNESNKTFQNPDTENSLEYLKQLKSKPGKKLEQKLCKVSTNKLESINKFNISFTKEDSNVQLGYALLNLEQNSDNEKLFLKVLDNISLSKTEAGMKFSEHIWTNKDTLNLSSNISNTLLHKFKYLYEKPIIFLATEILENLSKDSVDYEYKIFLEHTDIDNVLETCALDLELSSNIIYVINKLLALSGFDLRLFKMLENVQKYLQNKSL